MWWGIGIGAFFYVLILFTLGLMIGMAHALVVETLVLRTAGARAGRLLLYRLVMSVLVGWTASRLFIGAPR